MLAAHYKLDNFCVIVDNNGLQIDGNVADVMSPYPIVDKLEAFGFKVCAIDGHDFDQIEAAMNTVPGVDMSTGSLGQGISCAAGMALGLKHQGNPARVYTLLGDGEIQEGQVWEACMLAAHYKLDNFCVIVDNNGLQIDGNVADVMSPYPIVDKLEAFGFKVVAIDGHDFDQIEAAFNTARQTKGQPTAIVMKTVKGKDVSFMENNAGWHGKAPNDAEHEQAIGELKAILAELEGK